MCVCVLFPSATPSLTLGPLSRTYVHGNNVCVFCTRSFVTSTTTGIRSRYGVRWRFANRYYAHKNRLGYEIHVYSCTVKIDIIKFYTDDGFFPHYDDDDVVTGATANRSFPSSSGLQVVCS
jgi:hypothetical protein